MHLDLSLMKQTKINHLDRKTLYNAYAYTYSMSLYISSPKKTNKKKFLFFPSQCYCCCSFVFFYFLHLMCVMWKHNNYLCWFLSFRIALHTKQKLHGLLNRRNSFHSKLYYLFRIFWHVIWHLHRKLVLFWAWKWLDVAAIVDDVDWKSIWIVLFTLWNVENKTNKMRKKFTKKKTITLEIIHLRLGEKEKWNINLFMQFSMGQII